MWSRARARRGCDRALRPQRSCPASGWPPRTPRECCRRAPATAASSRATAAAARIAMRPRRPGPRRSPGVGTLREAGMSSPWGCRSIIPTSSTPPGREPSPSGGNIPAGWPAGGHGGRNRRSRSPLYREATTIRSPACKRQMRSVKHALSSEDVGTCSRRRPAAGRLRQQLEQYNQLIDGAAGREYLEPPRVTQ